MVVIGVARKKQFEPEMLENGQMVIPGMEELSAELTREKEQRKLLLKEAVDYWTYARGLVVYVGYKVCRPQNTLAAYYRAREDENEAVLAEIKENVLDKYYPETGVSGLKRTAKNCLGELEMKLIILEKICRELSTPVRPIDWEWVELNLMNKQMRRNFLSRLDTRLEHAKNGDLEEGKPISLRDV